MRKGDDKDGGCDRVKPGKKLKRAEVIFRGLPDKVRTRSVYLALAEAAHVDREHAEARYRALTADRNLFHGGDEA